MLDKDNNKKEGFSMTGNLFNATFEESTRLVKKEVITEGEMKRGDISSMSFWKRFSAFLLSSFVFGILLYEFGILMPIAVLESKESEILSFQSLQIIGELGRYLKPIFLTFYYLFFIIGFINLFPRKNYAKRILFGGGYLFIFLITVLISVLPFITGLSIDGTGYLGMFIQLLIGIALIIRSVKRESQKCKAILYDEKKSKAKKRGTMMTILTKYGGILILFFIANRYFFHIGSDFSNNPGLFGLLYGWAIIILLGAISIGLSIGFGSAIETYYFVKYADDYYKLFKPTDEFWYGKRKAKKKSAS